jgi:hypothetical protein
MSEFTNWWNESVGNNLNDFGKNIGLNDFLKGTLQNVNALFKNLSNAVGQIFNPTTLLIIVGGCVVLGGIYYITTKK